jgi:hypothetical protein
MEFSQRRFSKPAVRLLKTIVRTKGSYTFEAFVYEQDAIRQFNIHFLPNNDYYLIHFVKENSPLTPEHEGVRLVSAALQKVYDQYRDEWNGKKSIAELTCNFLSLLIDSQQVEVPEDVLHSIQREIKRIFLNPEIIKSDKLGRPYFSNAAIGKFFLTDVGTIDKSDYAFYNISIQ